MFCSGYSQIGQSLTTRVWEECIEIHFTSSALKCMGVASLLLWGALPLCHSLFSAGFILLIQRKTTDQIPYFNWKLSVQSPLIHMCCNIKPHSRHSLILTCWCILWVIVLNFISQDFELLKGNVSQQHLGVCVALWTLWARCNVNHVPSFHAAVHVSQQQWRLKLSLLSSKHTQTMNRKRNLTTLTHFQYKPPR